MNTYNLVDFCLKTELTFPELEILSSPDKKEELSLEPCELAQEISSSEKFHSWYQDQQIWLNLYQNQDSYYVEYPDACFFKLCLKQKKILYQKNISLDWASFRHLFLDQILPLVVSTKNRLVLHASAVADQQGAFIFLGATGNGKSSLAAELLSNCELISDDFVPCEFNSDWVINPTYPVLRLWSPKAPIRDSHELENMNISDKQRFKVEPRATNNQQYKVNALILLDRDADQPIGSIELTPVSEPAVFAAILNNIFVLETQSKKRQTQLLEQIGDFSAQIKTYNLKFSDLRGFGSQLYQELCAL